MADAIRTSLRSIVVLSVVGTLVGALFVFGLWYYWPEGGGQGRCPGGNLPHPVSGTCVREDQACRFDVVGSRREVTSCTADSRDGSVHVRWALDGTGTVLLTLRDREGTPMLEELVTLPATVTRSVTGLTGLWGLEARFDVARGDGFVGLWG